MVGLEEESAPTISKREVTLGMQPLLWDSQGELIPNGPLTLPSDAQNPRTTSMNKRGACLDMCLLEQVAETDTESATNTTTNGGKKSPLTNVYSGNDNIVVSAVTTAPSVVDATTIAATTTTSLRRNSALQKSHFRKSQTSNTLSHAIAAAMAAMEQEQAQVILETSADQIAVREVIIEKAQEIMMEKNRAGVQKGTVCPVCTGEDVDTEMIPCRHRLHAKCIKRWIEAHATCPVCREPVIDIEQCFGLTCPDIFKELSEAKAAAGGHEPSSCACGGAEAGEWGWFDDMDESERNLISQHALGGTSPSASSTSSSASIAPVAVKTYSTKTVEAISNPTVTTTTTKGGPTKRTNSDTYEFCRTFPPLTTEAPYSSSKHEWVRVLSCHRHLAVKIQISTFRIVEASPGSSEKFAEYCVEIDLDGRHIDKWKRYSAFCRFIKTLQVAEYRATHDIWRRITATGRWFNRLEVEYLNRRCKLLEEFACTLLHEAPTLYPLVEMLEC